MVYRSEYQHPYMAAIPVSGTDKVITWAEPYWTVQNPLLWHSLSSCNMISRIAKTVHVRMKHHRRKSHGHTCQQIMFVMNNDLKHHTCLCVNISSLGSSVSSSIMQRLILDSVSPGDAVKLLTYLKSLSQEWANAEYLHLVLRVSPSSAHSYPAYLVNIVMQYSGVQAY